MKKIIQIIFILLVAVSLSGCPYDRLIHRLTSVSYNE